MRRFVSFRGLACFTLAWLAIPAVALADDCSAWTLAELPSCVLLANLLPPFLVAAALLAAASWLGSQFPEPGAIGPEERQRMLEKEASDSGLKPFGAPPDEAAERTSEGLKGLIGRE